ncbi:acyltransferase [Francisella sp. Scap27]|uniref:acyltransferase family protein n=1 Tax=Francisella sp. Scap27 TaxID=2589986 RepID=UPI0015BC9B68|nr:acyltransferase family protein [Francisella sp. Scap27]QLE78685.1 acyltransferase [Francisella sp. Scap27]
MQYRKDIDGLRAFAVISVVLFHLNISWVKSGFLGVDIFFVISGYLITTIVIRDLENQMFSIKNFYLRRIRRILPALIVVLFFSTFFAWLILLPQDLVNYSESATSAIASFSNLFFFIKLDFGYFGADSATIPLLHTWSLGVEEQFYIVWPVILAVMYKAKISGRKSLLTISTILFIISILFFLSVNSNIYILNSQRWYYFPLHRAFELLFGCILSIILVKYKSYSSNKILLNTLSVIAAICLITPVYFVEVPFPSYWTIVACLGASLFIYSGSGEVKPFCNRLLSFKPFVAIGLISYSLYLWHWPIIAFVNYLSIDKTSLVCFAILVISMLIATLSYLFVEKPFRHKYKFSFSKSVLFLWIVPIIFFAVFCLSAKYLNIGFNQPKTNQNTLTYSYKFDSIDNNKCFLMRQSAELYSKQLPNPKYCTFGDADSKQTNYLIIGDSHARSEVPMLQIWLKNINQKAFVVTQKTTPFLYSLANIIEGVSAPDRNNAIKNLIKSKKYKYVVLSGEWSKDIYSDYISSLKQSVKLIIDNGSIPILILDTPILSPSMNNLCSLEKQSLPFLFKENACQLDVNYVSQQQQSFINLVGKIKKDYPQLIVIDPKKALCNDKYCNTEIDNTPVYADSNHLNYIGSELLGKEYLKKFGNPLKNL